MAAHSEVPQATHDMVFKLDGNSAKIPHTRMENMSFRKIQFAPTLNLIKALNRSNNRDCCLRAHLLSVP